MRVSTYCMYIHSPRALLTALPLCYVMGAISFRIAAIDRPAISDTMCHWHFFKSNNLSKGCLVQLDTLADGQCRMQSQRPARQSMDCSASTRRMHCSPSISYGYCCQSESFIPACPGCLISMSSKGFDVLEAFPETDKPALYDFPSSDSGR